MNAMIYGTLSGEVDWRVVGKVISCAVENFAGLPWDQTSGFSLDATRETRA
jgi:hypothetical protein